MKDFNLEEFLTAFSGLNSEDMRPFFAREAQWKISNETPIEVSSELGDFVETFHSLTKFFKVNAEHAVRSENKIFFSGNFDVERTDEKSFSIPVAMRMTLENEKIKEAQTYCDLTSFMADKVVPI